MSTKELKKKEDKMMDNNDKELSSEILLMEEKVKPKIEIKLLTMDYLLDSKSIDEVIKNPIGNMILGQDYKNSSNKKYFAIPKEENDYIMKKLSKDNNLYELICKNIPIKFYFDLEIKKLKIDRNVVYSDLQILKIMKMIIINSFKECYGYDIGLTDLCCLSSGREDKLSYHVIIRVNYFEKEISKGNYYAKDIDEAHYFANYVSLRILELSKEPIIKFDNDSKRKVKPALLLGDDIPIELLDYNQLLTDENHTLVDTTVYKPNQLMRMINQSKAETKKGVCPSGTLELMQKVHRKFSDTFITFFDTKDKIMIDESKRKVIPIKTPVIKPKNKEKELENIKEKMKNGDRFLSDDMILKTGTYLKEELKISENEFKTYPEWMQCLYLIKPQKDYKTWFSIGIAVLSTGDVNASAEFIKFSKLNKEKYEEGEIEIIIKSGFKKDGFKIGTLRYIARKSNEEYYKKEKKRLLDDLFNIDKTGIIVREEKTKYLSTNADGTPNNNIITDSKFLALCSGLGTGKTLKIQSLRGHYESVLCITPRASFSIFASTTYELINYKEKNALESKTLSIQLESVFKLKNSDIGFPLIFVDESESLFRQFSSSTMAGKTRETFEIMKILILRAKKVIFADGFITQRTIMYCQMFVKIEDDLKKKSQTKNLIADESCKSLDNPCGKSLDNPLNSLIKNNIITDSTINTTNTITLLINTHEKEVKLNAIQLNEGEIILKIIDDVLNTKYNIFVAVCSKKVSDYILSEIITKNRELINSEQNLIKKAEREALESEIIYFSKDSTANVLKTLNDVNENWKSKRLILCTPTLTCGISYSDEAVKHFDRGYFVTTYNSCVVGDVMQQMFRVRHYKENTIYFSVKTSVSFYGVDSFVDESIKSLTVIGPLYSILCKKYLKELEDLGEDKDEEYFKYKQSLKDYEDKKVDEDLLRILMFNLNEQKLSKLYFTQLLIEHMEISNVKVTLLDKIEPIKKSEKIDYDDEVTAGINLANYIAIKTVNDLEFDKNQQIINDKGNDLLKATMENYKFMFLKYIDSSVVDMEKSKLFYGYYMNGKANLIKHVYYEKNKTPQELAMKELLRKEGMLINCEKTALKLYYVLEINKVLGLNGSYDIETVIPKEKLSLLKNLVKSDFVKMKNAFGFKITFPKEMDDTTYNRFANNLLQYIYNNFNGNKFVVSNKDNINKKHLDEITYCLKGLDLGRIIKKTPIKEVVNIEELLAFDTDKENNNKHF